MSIPTTKQCCCGCTLRTGVLILAYLGVIGCILNLLQYGAVMSAPQDHTAEEKMRVSNPVAVIINGILSAMLLYGVYKECRPIVLAVVYIQLGLSVIGLIALVAVAIIYNIPWVLPISIIGLFIGLYFLWVEYSYAEELLENQSSPKSLA